MSRLSFRPRPLDPHKKLPILKSIKDFDDFDEAPTSASTRNSQILRIAAAEADEAQQIPAKKAAPEIPTPQFVDVDTYKRDYLSTFTQTTSYLRGRGARAELGDFVEYDLDNEDEDWLAQLKNESDVEQNIITPEKLESILFKLEVLDHKARERAGIMTATLGLPIPVLLQPDAAMEALQALCVPYGEFDAIYKYWKCKRERWQKPILRRLQPPPSVNDTNPYNVFRPREKAHRLHTRRMQRRENNVQSFEKLRQVRRNLDQAKMILEALIKREEKKREFMENEVNLQRIQMKYKHDAELIQDSLTLPGYQNSSYKFGSSDEEFVDSDDASRNPHPGRSAHFRGPRQVSILHPKRESRQQRAPTSWLHKLDAGEPIMMFTKPLDAEKLALAGIVPPSGCRLRGRMGRGGRIVFDRCDPLMRMPINAGTPKHRSTVQFL